MNLKRIHKRSKNTPEGKTIALCIFTKLDAMTNVQFLMELESFVQKTSCGDR